MGFKIPLNLLTKAPSTGAEKKSGIRLSVPINLSRKKGKIEPSPDRQTQTLRAVAAAAALLKADCALKKAKEARDYPEKVIEPNVSEDQLAELITVVSEAQDSLLPLPLATIEQVAAARAVDVNPVQVRAACDKMQEDEAYIENGIAWVAAFDGELLRKAAREGARQLMLNKVPAKATPASLANRIEILEDQLMQLQKLDQESEKKSKSSSVKGKA